MLVPLFTLSTTNFALSGWKFRLACQATFLVGWIHSSLSAPFVWSIGLLGPYGFLHPMVLPVTPSPHCCSLAHFRCHSYTYSCLHYNPTRLLQLTLCWHPSCVATVPRPGLAFCCTPSGCIPEFGHVSSYMLDVLHWLPLQQRISYHVISFVWGSLLGLAPACLRGLCCTTMGIPGRRSLCSTERGFLIIPFAHTTTKQNRVFSVVGPSLWNGLSLALRLYPRVLSFFIYL